MTLEVNKTGNIPCHAASTNNYLTNQSNPKLQDSADRLLKCPAAYGNVMNIVYAPLALVTAKTCGCREGRQVTCAFSTEPHDLCHGKKDVIEAQINACKKLLKYTPEASEKSTIEKEISELKMALDLMA